MWANICRSENAELSAIPKRKLVPADGRKDSVILISRVTGRDIRFTRADLQAWRENVTKRYTRLLLSTAPGVRGGRWPVSGPRTDDCRNKTGVFRLICERIPDVLDTVRMHRSSVIWKCWYTRYSTFLRPKTSFCCTEHTCSKLFFPRCQSIHLLMGRPCLPLNVFFQQATYIMCICWMYFSIVEVYALRVVLVCSYGGSVSIKITPFPRHASVSYDSAVTTTRYSWVSLSTLHVARCTPKLLRVRRVTSAVAHTCWPPKQKRRATGYIYQVCHCLGYVRVQYFSEP